MAMINDITLTSRTNDFANVSSTTAGLILINWRDCGTHVIMYAGTQFIFWHFRVISKIRLIRSNNKFYLSYFNRLIK